VTIGISPSRAETGYGYIRTGDALPEYDVGYVRPHIAAEFVEKPELARAEEFLKSGNYYWNAGIFVMKAAQVLAELDAAGGAEAKSAETVRWSAAQDSKDRNTDVALERFSALESISIDKAVMERSSRVAVIPAALKWSDVGSLLALADVSTPDASGNVRVGRGVDIDSYDNIVYSSDRLVATLGVDDLIVVDTTDARSCYPVARRMSVRWSMRSRPSAPEVTQPRISLRPCGSWQSAHMTRYQIKLGSSRCKPSLQSHQHEANTDHRTGTAVVIVTMTPSSADEREHFIPCHSPHREPRYRAAAGHECR
jgi:hypothetical protein